MKLHKKINAGAYADPSPQDSHQVALEFRDVPLDEKRPLIWTINDYARPTGRHYDVHVGLEMGVVLQGKSRRLYSNYDFIARPGELWFTGLWEPHGMQILDGDTRHFVLGFLPEFLGVPDISANCDWMQLFRLPPAERPRATSTEQCDAALEFANRATWLLQSCDPYRLAKVRILIQQFLLLFMSAFEQTSPHDSQGPLSASHRSLLSALRMIDQHPDRKITLADGARAANMSRSHFAKEFHEQTGVTFARYLLRRRLGGVMGDLRTTDRKLQTIAARWGFADASHLVRVFKNQTGETPVAYRNQRVRLAPMSATRQVDRMPRPALLA